MSGGQPRPRELRYVGEAFEQEGVWYREGKLGPYHVLDQLDTTRVWLGKRDEFCCACGAGVSHSWRYHHHAIHESRRKAICAPRRPDATARLTEAP